MVKTARAPRRSSYASPFAQLVDQRDFPAVVVRLHQLNEGVRNSVGTARERLQGGQQSQLDAADVETLQRLSTEDVLDDGMVRFVAIEVGWRRLAFETPLFANDVQSTREAFDTFFSPPFEPYDADLHENEFALVLLERLGKQYHVALDEMVRNRRQSMAEQRKSSLDQETLLKMTKTWARDAERLIRKLAALLSKFPPTQSTPSAAATQSQHNSQDSLPTPDPSSDGHEPLAAAPRPALASAKPSKKRPRAAEDEAEVQAEAPAPVRVAKEVIGAAGERVRAEEEEQVAMNIDEAPQTSATTGKSPSDAAPAPLPPFLSSQNDAQPPAAPAVPARAIAAFASEDASSQPQPLPRSSRSRPRNSDAILALIGQGAQDQQRRLKEERRRSEIGTDAATVEGEGQQVGQVSPAPPPAPPHAEKPDQQPSAPLPKPTADAPSAHALSTSALPPILPPPSPASRPPRRSKTPLSISETVQPIPRRSTRSRSPLPPVSEASASGSGSQRSALGPSASAILMPPPPPSSSSKKPSLSPVEAAAVPPPVLAPVSSGEQATNEDSQGSNGAGYVSSSSTEGVPPCGQPQPALAFAAQPVGGSAPSSSAPSLANALPLRPPTTTPSSQETSTSLSQDGSLPNPGSRGNLLLVPDTPVASAEAVVTAVAVEQVEISRGSTSSGFVVADSQGSSGKSSGSGSAQQQQQASSGDVALPPSPAAAEAARPAQQQENGADSQQTDGDSSGLTYISLREAAELDRLAVEKRREREQAAAVAAAGAESLPQEEVRPPQLQQDEQEEDSQPFQTQAPPPERSLEVDSQSQAQSQAGEASGWAGEDDDEEEEAGQGEDEYAYGGIMNESQIMPFSQAVEFDEDEDEDDEDADEGERGHLDDLDDLPPQSQAPAPMDVEEEESSPEGAAAGTGRVRPRRTKSFGEVDSEADELASQRAMTDEEMDEDSRVFAEFLQEDILE
ncbi:hypothetical protein JCM6882_003190 [Rhodosporidiobolus microsporus]